MHDAELEAFTRINLAEFLQEREGWLKDKAESTKKSIKLRRGSEVLICNERAGVWLYFNPQEPSDKGSIIHYLQSRRGRGYTLGHVRKELRGMPLPAAPAASWEAAEREATPIAARTRWLAGKALGGGLPAYLASRGLNAATVKAYGSPIRTDRRGNLMFAHTDDAGQVTGYEIRSPTFKGFSRGGLRHLCRFGPLNTGEPLKIALCESAVDALSLAQMVRRSDALLCSTGGVVGTNTVEAVKALSDRHPYAELLLAFDDDKAGARYSQAVQEAVSGRAGGVRRLLPSGNCKDWNDLLQGRCQPAALPSFHP